MECYKNTYIHTYIHTCCLQPSDEGRVVYVKLPSLISTDNSQFSHREQEPAQQTLLSDGSDLVNASIEKVLTIFISSVT